MVIIKHEVRHLETGALVEPMIIACNKCSTHIVLDDSWANECDKCHTEYNCFGQQLAPRCQWGHETGETF